MLKFFKKLGAKAPEPETQRQTVERALEEVNAVVAGLEEKPKLGFDPVSGEISLELPEQMPDEALALPKPEAADAAPDAEDEAGEKAAEGETEEAAKAAA